MLILLRRVNADGSCRSQLAVQRKHVAISSLADQSTGAATAKSDRAFGLQLLVRLNLDMSGAVIID